VQLGVKNGSGLQTFEVPLSELPLGQGGRLSRLLLPETFARRLMELGFIPGSYIQLVGRAPGGDPQIYRVDGVDIALRKETATHLLVEVP
jgi:Fe2+ transport system protein FeoA